MCFSENASILSFTFGVIGSLLCVSLGTVSDKIVGFFMLFVSFMQGVEYLLWRHQKCDSYNKTISVIGMALNHLQPIVLGLLVVLFNPKLSQTNLHWIYSFITIYLFAIIPYSIQFLQDSDSLCTIKNKETTHLQWNWNSMKFTEIIYLIFLITICAFFLLGLPKLSYGIYASLTAIITFSTSLYFYPQKHSGALWCYYIVYLPILYYLIRKIIFF